MKSFKLYPLLFLLAFIACSKKQHSTKSNATGNGPHPVVNQRAFDEAFYEGNKQMILGNHQDAINFFKKCIGLDPKSDVATYLLAKEYYNIRQYSLSLSLAQQAIKLNDKNIWYQGLAADDLKITGKNLEAAKIQENIADKFPNNQTYYFDATENYIVAQKYNDAIRCLDKLEKVSGVNDEISFKKIEMYLKLNKKEPAYAELQKLINTFPERKKYPVALAELYFDFREEAKALEALKQILSKDPDMPDAHLLLANIYRSKGENNKSFEELKLVFANPDADVKRKLDIISTYIPMIGQNMVSKSQAMELGSILVKTHPDDDACNMVYGDILYTAEQYADAKPYYLKALGKNKSNFNLWENLIECEDQLKEYDPALKHSDEALDAFPTQVIFYYYKAYFAYRLKDYKTAATTAKNGLDIGSDKTQLLLQLYSIIGDANNELKNYTESDEAFDKLLELDPVNLQTLNNYSYYLSLRKQKLDKAEAMSKKSLDIDPNNASYLDTYGWILYQQKKYADARLFIEKALLQEPNNGTLNEHLGDVYYQLNEIDKALSYWKKAQENGNKSANLAQKIIAKKLLD